MVVVTRVIKRRRGRSQPWLMEGEDQEFYVVKAANNPQGRRTLVNDWIGSKLLRLLGVNAADCKTIRIPEILIETNDLYLQFGSKQVPVDSGPHFGSVCPVNPERASIYDYLPSSLLSQVTNIDDFYSTFVFDRWTANADSRQAVFYRPGRCRKLHALMIDQGSTFQGVLWEFADLRRPRDFYEEAYKLTASYEHLERIMERLSAISEQTLGDIVREIPTEWLEGDDQAALTRLLKQLIRRQAHVLELVDRATSTCTRAGDPDRSASGAIRWSRGV